MVRWNRKLIKNKKSGSDDNKMGEAEEAVRTEAALHPQGQRSRWHTHFLLDCKMSSSFSSIQHSVPLLFFDDRLSVSIWKVISVRWVCLSAPEAFLSLTAKVWCFGDLPHATVTDNTCRECLWKSGGTPQPCCQCFFVPFAPVAARLLRQSQWGATKSSSVFSDINITQMCVTVIGGGALVKISFMINCSSPMYVHKKKIN